MSEKIPRYRAYTIDGHFEGNMANVIGLKHIDSVSVNFCFHCGKSAKEILKKIGKEAK